MRGLLVFACRAFPPDASRRPERRGRRHGPARRGRLAVARRSRGALARCCWAAGAPARRVGPLAPGRSRRCSPGPRARQPRGGAGRRRLGRPPAPGASFFGFCVTGVTRIVVDWWWIAFALAAAGIVLGLVLGDRRLAVGAALANLGLVAYDALFLVHGTDWTSGHLASSPRAGLGFPGGRHWLVPAIVLVLATAAAPLRRRTAQAPARSRSSPRCCLSSSRETSGGFLFLRWPLAAVVVLAVAFGRLAPRLAVVAVGVTLAAAPGVVGYLTAPYRPPRSRRDLGRSLPGSRSASSCRSRYLTRRRLT